MSIPRKYSFSLIYNQGIRQMLLVVLFFLMAIPRGYSQENGYDETSVVLYVPRIGSIDIDAMIHKQEAYLSVHDIFDFLKIKNTPSSDLDSISGFFIHPSDPFLLNKEKGCILYQGKILKVPQKDMIRTETNLYLKAVYFGQVFGLDCAFSFRNLSVTLTTKSELPAIIEMKQEQMRNNISRLKGEKKADTTISRQFSWFNPGVADWSVTTTEATSQKVNTRAALSLGAIVAGGEATATLNYNSSYAFRSRDQYFTWKYVNNEHSGLRQINAGRLIAKSISSIFDPVTGIQFTNSPTTYRRSFGTYRISNTTDPGWMVELYVNNVLVNYVKADASGFYTFEVPLVYGNSAIQLRFYGPWGEERTEEQNISIPYNFLPSKQFEYNVSAGIVDDGKKSRFTRVDLHYGFNNRITIGGGMEYLSSASSGKPIPFLDASVRLSTQLLVSGEWAHDVSRKATLHYRLPYNVQLDLDYASYKQGQTAIRYNYLEERKASLSIPLFWKKISVFSHLTFHQIILPKSKYTSTEFLLSGIVCGVSSNFTTYALFNDGYAGIYSNISFALHLPFDLRFTPRIEYSYREKKINTMKGEVEKRAGKKGFMTLSYEKNFSNHIGYLNAGVRFNLAFAQTAFSASHSNRSNSLVQAASGSLLIDTKTHLLDVNNQGSVGRGGVIIVPFLDLNCNGYRDTNEKLVNGLKFRMNGGRIEHNDDGSFRIEGLEAYRSYLIEVDKNSFDKIAWQIKKPVIRVTIEPDHFKLISVPITVVGEASGMVYLKSDQVTDGISRILVNIYDSNSVKVGRTLTEGDGYFDYFGLAPGTYTVRVDSTQLSKLNLKCSPANLSIEIASSEDGVVADGFQFILESISKDSAKGSFIESRLPVFPEIRQPVVQHKATTGKIPEKTSVNEDKQPIAGGSRNTEISVKNDMRSKPARELEKPELPFNVIQTPVRSANVKQQHRSTVRQSPVRRITIKRNPKPQAGIRPPERAKLVRQNPATNQKLIRARQEMQRLMKVHRLLILKNQQLLMEIHRLRLKFQQLNLKDIPSSGDLKDHLKKPVNIFRPWSLPKQDIPLPLSRENGSF